MTALEYTKRNEELARFIDENLPPEKMGLPIPAFAGLTGEDIAISLQYIDGERDARLIERIEQAGGADKYYACRQSGNCSFPDTDPSNNFDS